MKKLVSILLVAIMLLSFMSVSVFASTVINDELQTHLDAMDDDDLIWVWIWIRSQIDTEAIERQARIECGLPIGTVLQTQEEIDMYSSARTRLISAFHKAENQAVIDKIGVAEENIDYLGTLSPSFIVQLTKEQVEYAVSLDEVTSVSYYEETVTEPDIWDPEWSPYLFKKDFVDKYVENDYISYTYDEIYKKINEKSELEWVLVCASIGGPNPAMYYAVFDDMVSLRGECQPFANNYAVYDVSKFEFIDICDLESLDDYEGLREQIYEQDFLYPIGDADFDKELTILDATYIQMVAAQLCSFHAEDDLTERLVIKGELSYVSDMNRDGKRDVLDATAIQLKLAGLQ